MTAEGLTNALASVWEIVGSAVDFIAENPILMVCFVAGLVPVGFKIFKKARKSVGA